MKRSGTIRVGTAGGRGGAPDTVTIKKGDATALQFGEVHSVENKGRELLEFLIVSVSRDAHSQMDDVEPRVFLGRGGRGRGN